MSAPSPIRARSLPALLGVALLGSIPSQAAPPVMKALVIGNAHYSSVGALRNPENDAHDMCAALSNLGFSTSCLVDVKTRLQLRAVIEDFVDSLPVGAVSIIYYAGHGVQVQGENYLVPTDARLADEASVRESAVSLSFLMRQLQRHTGFLTVVILDACRDNPLHTSGRPLPAGLAQITDIPAATQIVYATAANEPAVDGTGRNGIFTRSLLQHLMEPGTIDDLFKKVSQSVQKDTAALGISQRPSLYTNFSGEFCLVECGTVTTESRPPEVSREEPAPPKRRTFVPPAL